MEAQPAPVAPAWAGWLPACGHRLPKLARQLPHAPVRDVETEYPLCCVEHANPHGVADAVRVFQR